jgi:hypothetical protein
MLGGGSFFGGGLEFGCDPPEDTPAHPVSIRQATIASTQQQWPGQNGHFFPMTSII